MPEITDLLRDAAGRPLAPLDLDAVITRGAQHRRNRRLTRAAAGSSLALVGVVAGLVLTSGSSGTETVVPAQTPSPKVSAASAVEPDGVSYGYLTSATTVSAVTYDKADYLKQACDARTDERDLLEHARAAKICFSNTNPKLRTVPFASDVTIVQHPDGDPQRVITPADLRAAVHAAPYNAWQITIRGGKVVRLEELPVASA